MKSMMATKKGKLNLHRESLVELDAKALTAANGGAASVHSWMPFACFTDQCSHSCYCPTK